LTAALKVNDVSSGYGKLPILNDVSVEAKRGEVTVIVGPNGSGKSTLLKTVAGLATLFKGTVELDGKVVSGKPADEVAKLGIAYLPQTESTFSNLSVQDNFRLAGYMIDSESYSSRLERTLILFPKLKSYLNTRSKNLSGGERQMLAMGMAMLREPVVMMYDEPTANLAPNLADQVFEMIVSLARKSNLITLLVEQNARAALKIGDIAYLLVSGECAFHGSCQELIEHKELAQLYLGFKA
jgi:branched-chain amino acid transport system ATP-binding protein